MRVSIQSITKSYGDRELFKDFSLELDGGSRLAVVGPNGTGKSTFLKMVAGRDKPDSGRVSLNPRETGVGYSTQELSLEDLEHGLLDWVLEVLPSWSDFWAEWEQAVAAEDQGRLEELSRRQAHWEQVHGYNPEHKAKAVLTGLGFGEDDWQKNLLQLSGGWRERAKLARVLLMGQGLLLLDEPTNHLDLEAVEWLEGYLVDYPGILIFVAHDRVFLDRVSTHVLSLGGSRPVVRRGSFSQYQEWQKEIEEQRRREARRLSDEIERKMAFVERFRAKATKARQAQSQKKQAVRLERELSGLAPDKRLKTLSFSWPEPRRGNQTVMSAVGLNLAYAKGEWLWEPLNFQVYNGQKIGLVGPNGCGKSTLLKLITGKLQPGRGSVSLGPNTVIGSFSQHQTEVLKPGQNVIAEARRLSDPRTTDNELMSVLGRFLLGQEYWDRPTGTLSGGEKSRLILATLFLVRANFLILDEPTNHLDLESREALVESLRDFSGTILMVAHDRYLLSEVPGQIWTLGRQGLKPFEGSFWDYEQQLRETGAPSPGSDGAGREQGQKSRMTPKEAKRVQAVQRNQLYAALKPKKQAYEKMEQELESVLENQDRLEQKLSSPETYGNPDELARLNKSYAAAQERSEVLLARLAELEREIKGLESGAGHDPGAGA